MSVEQFTSVAGQVAPLVEEVCLHLMGEPTMHPHLKSILDICEEKGLRVNLTTNGLLLSGERRAAAFHPALRQINFSVQSFFDNFPDRDFRPYVDKLINLTEEIEVTRPDLYVNFRLWDAPHSSELSDVSQKVIGRIEATFGPCEDLKNFNIRRKRGYKLRNRIYINLDTRFVWPSLEESVRGNVGTCHGLRNHFGIHVDGKVVACCLDKEATLAVGHAFQGTVADALSSGRAQNMRQGFETFELRESMCQRCDFVKRFAQGKTAKSRVLQIGDLDLSQSLDAP